MFLSYAIEAGSEPAGLLAVVGRLHPVLLHLPIGTLAALVVLEILTWFLGLDDRRRSTGILAWFTALTALGSSATGYVLSFEGAFDAAAVESHRNAALAFTGLTCLTAILHWRAAARGGSPFLYFAALTATTGLVFVAGHLGGTLTHGEGFLTEPLRGRGATASTPAPESKAFAILQARCSECHFGDARKGKLSLETRDSLLTGGKNGPAFDAANPPASLLLTRVRLGLEEKGHMPPKAKAQLTPEELAALEAWIASGVPVDSFPRRTDATGASAPASAPKKAPEPDAEAIAALRAKFVHVERLARDASSLWIDFTAPAGRLGEAEILALLSPLEAHVAELALNRCKVGDGAMAALAAMPLTRLELRETAVGDAGVAELAKHAGLAELVLTQSRVTDASIDALVKMPGLKRVYLWGTGITPEGVARLRQARKELYVDAGDAPAAAPLVVEEPPKLTNEASPPPPAASAAATGAPVNGTCPVSGDPVNVKYTISFGGRLIAFCCPNCPSKFWAKPEDYLSKLPK